MSTPLEMNPEIVPEHREAAEQLLAGINPASARDVAHPASAVRAALAQVHVSLAILDVLTEIRDAIAQRPSGRPS